MGKTVWVVAVILIPTAFAATDSLYVRLYQSKLKRAQLNLTLAQANQKFCETKLERRQKLVAGHNVSDTELAEIVRDSAAATAATQNFEAVVHEAEAMLLIAKTNDDVGKPTPVCLELK